MIKVTNEVETSGDKATPSIKVHNHWNSTNLVELEVDGKRYVVVAKELKAAIDNACNTARF